MFISFIFSSFFGLYITDYVTIVLDREQNTSVLTEFRLFCLIVYLFQSYYDILSVNYFAKKLFTSGGKISLYN